EVDRLAALGARALTGARARDAAGAVATAIRDTVGVDVCAVWAVDALPGDSYALRLLADTASGADDDTAPPLGAELAARERTVVAERMDGTMRLARAPSASLLRALTPLDPAELHAVSVPLTAAERVDGGDDGPLTSTDRAGERLVGVLRIAAHDGLRVPAERWRYLDALAAYAALAADRERLAGAAERTAALEDAARAKDAVLAAVSHDLRTPLTSIKAHAHALRTAPAGTDAGEEAATIEAEADRLARLVGDLLDLSRLQAGAMPVAADVVAVDDLLDVVLQRVAGALGDAARGGRVLDVTLPPGAPLVLGRFDVAQAARALVNLVENANKYAPIGTPIEVVVREASDGPGSPTWLCIDVCDRGPGVGVAERERIFAPFYRAPGARVDAGGAGLGLAIARGLAERQGGTVSYAPREGGGSVFTLQLPGARLADGALADPVFMDS
ncbi:MAG TPA: HAMP domain-containing sensor histidine kinase, partial [Gemmatirosa sp.]